METELVVEEVVAVMEALGHLVGRWVVVVVVDKVNHRMPLCMIMVMVTMPVDLEVEVELKEVQLTNMVVKVVVD